MTILGKPNRQVMADAIFRQSGARSPRVLQGPKPGLDVSILSIAPGRVMVLSTDPISLIPQLGPEKSGWLSVHAIASDLATSGVRPQYAMFDLNLPPSITDSQLRSYWNSIHETCRKLGIAILGGHTGRFEGCDYSVVGGGTFFGLGDRESYVTSDMAKHGDDLIMTKTAAIEAVSVLSLCFPRTIQRSLGTEHLRNARKLFGSISVVEDALTAASVGIHNRGVSAMHDVTEGGVLSAAIEMADASGLKAMIQADAIPVADETRRISELFRMDPLSSLGQGSLLIAARPENSVRIMRALEAKRIPSCNIGTLQHGKTHTRFDAAGHARELTYPREDPYWKAYWRGVDKGWK